MVDALSFILFFVFGFVFSFPVIIFFDLMIGNHPNFETVFWMAFAMGLVLAISVSLA